jgi:hypothetical protein
LKTEPYGSTGSTQWPAQSRSPGAAPARIFKAPQKMAQRNYLQIPLMIFLRSARSAAL